MNVRKRIARIIERSRRGELPSAIGSRYRIPAKSIRAILSLHGENVPEPNYDRAHAMWDMSEAERRIAVAKRAAQGARDTRLSHENT